MPLDVTTPSTGLTQSAYASLSDMFDRTNHRPSTEQWRAIRDLLEHLEKAADGCLEPAVYLSAIPAGTGKTATVSQFAVALMADPGRSEVGMLIAVNRITEVEDMATMLGDWRHRLCVIAGKGGDPVRALGEHDAADEAQVVICTQASLKRTLKALRSFDDAARFLYRGRRRSVVAWDEAFQFNLPVVLDPHGAVRLASAMRHQSPDAACALVDWVSAAQRAPEGQCEVPDFEALGLDWQALQDAVSDDEETLAQAQALGVLSGKVGHVINAGNRGVLVSCIPELPPNLVPLIVTDASAARGVHHASYEQMSRTRRIIRLTEASKTYRNLGIRLVPVSASRSAYGDKAEAKGRALIEMAVAYIRKVTPDPVLIVSYPKRVTMKGVKENTIKEAIMARLESSERLRTQHVTWGRHTATNAHTDVRHVVLTGLNFLPDAAAHAASGAAQDMAMDSPAAQPSVDQVADMRRGMLRDSTMQAILRGNARKAADGDCGAMVAVVFQSPQKGLSKNDYRGMFPGANVVTDTTLLPIKPLTGRLLDLSRAVLSRLGEGVTEMANADLTEAIGMSPRDFRRLMKRPQWRPWVDTVGLVPCVLAGNRPGLRRVQGDHDAHVTSITELATSTARASTSSGDMLSWPTT